MSDGGAVAVSRIDYRLLRQRKQLLLHRTHQRTHTAGGEIGSAHGFLEQGIPAAVSYTHLTLPTTILV